MLGFDFTRVFKDPKGFLNTLGMARQSHPDDAISKVRGIQGKEEKVDKNAVLDEDVVAALQTRILDLEEANEALVEEKNACTQQLMESLQNQNSLRSSLNDCERKIEFLQSTLDNHDRLLKQSQTERLSLRNALDSKIEALRQYDERIRSLMDEVDKTQQKELALRQIILDKAGSEKVSDQAMVSKFVTIRQKIQNIARLHHYHVDQPLKMMDDPDRAEFFEEKTWRCLTTGDRINRVRSMIFSAIHEFFLDYPLFGLECYKLKDTHNGKYIEVASGLRVFERLLEERKVSAGAVSDWRVLTIECIEQLDYQNPAVDYVSAYIFRFLGPLLASHVSDHDKDWIRNKIKDVCDEAMSLGMLMRTSRDLYMVKVPGKEGLPLLASACSESLVEPMGVEGGKPSEAGDEIAHTIFGALVKQPENGDGRQMVLEVAHVILKKEEKAAISMSVNQTGKAG